MQTHERGESWTTKISQQSCTDLLHDFTEIHFISSVARVIGQINLNHLNEKPHDLT